MLAPQRSRIVAVEHSYPCPTCKKAGVMVTFERANGDKSECWTHDDGSFIQWTGELNTQ